MALKLNCHLTETSLKLNVTETEQTEWTEQTKQTGKT